MDFDIVVENNLNINVQGREKKIEYMHFEKLMMLGQFLQVRVAKSNVVNPRKLIFRLPRQIFSLDCFFRIYLNQFQTKNSCIILLESQK